MYQCITMREESVSVRRSLQHFRDLRRRSRSEAYFSCKVCSLFLPEVAYFTCAAFEHLMESSDAAEKASSAEPGAEVENPATHQKLVSFLQSKGVSFQQSQHEPVRTSQQAADVRFAGASLRALLSQIIPFPFAIPVTEFVFSVWRLCREFLPFLSAHLDPPFGFYSFCVIKRQQT